MSEFIAEAQVLIRPNTTLFRAQLQEEVNRAVSQVTVPPIALQLAAGGAAGAAAVTSSLAAAQREATVTTGDLATAARVENTTWARQAVLLEAVSAETLQKAGADATATAAARSHAAAQGQVSKAAIASTAGMLGLRGAVLTAGSAFIAATVGFQALGKAVQSTIDFTRELAVFRVTAGATAEQMRQVSDAARQLGRDITLPGVSAGDAAQALTELSKAGLSVQQSIDAARGTLQLATAAEIDNSAAAELVANSLNAFGLAGDEATRVADLLAGAANASQGSITDMGLALKQAAAAANVVGLNLNDTVTLLTELSRAGLSASDAGTSLRTLLLRLVGDFPKVQAEVKRLNLALRDVNGNIRPEFFSELGNKLDRMTPKARQFTLALLGGSDAIRSISILSRQSVASFNATEEAISRSGIASEVASAQTEGLGGDVEAAKNQFADLGLTVGKVASGPLSVLVRSAGAAAGAINDVNAAVEESTGGGGVLHQFGLFINDFANSFARLNISFQEGVRLALKASDGFTVLGDVAKADTDAINGLIEAIQNLGEEATKNQGRPKDQGLGVQQVLNRVSGFNIQETQARIHGDNVALVNVLQQEADFLNAQLDRQFVKNRPALRTKLLNQLLGVTNDLGAINTKAAADKKKVADDLKKKQDEADRALLQALSNRRDQAELAISAAANTTQTAQDDIAAQNRLQALIQAQIKKIREQVKDQETRKQAIHDLRVALIRSRQEEEKLRAEQKQQAKERASEILDIKIQIAETRGQEKLEAELLRRKIAQLKKRIAAAKKDKLLRAQLQLELAQTQKQLKDLQKQEKDNNKTSQEFFNFLQTQAGFAANLLGNLIPGSATAGLVGGQATARTAGPQPGDNLSLGIPAQGVAASAALAASRDRGVRPIQVDTTNQLLRQILRVLQHVNGRQGHPEARYNDHMLRASFDGVHGN